MKMLTRRGTRDDATARATAGAERWSLVALLVAVVSLATIHIHAQAPGISLFTTQVPIASTSTLAWELGTRLTADVPGRVIGIRFYKWPGDPGPHVGHLWSASGVLRAEVPFDHETAAGWQQQLLVVPIVMAAGASWTVSVNAVEDAHFAVSPGGLAAGLITGPLVTTPTGGASIQAPGRFPLTRSAHNYFRDVVFLPDVVIASGTITIAPDPAAPGGFTATLNGFAAGPYTLSLSLTNAAGMITTTARAISMPLPSTDKAPE